MSNLWTPRADLFASLHNAGTAAGLSPLDSTSYYWGQFTLFNPSTSAVSQRILVARACRLVGVRWVTIVQGAGSTENVTCYIRKNDTTDTTLGTQQWNVTTGNTWSAPTDFTSPEFAIGDDFVWKFTGPVWATNPTGIIVSAYAFWEKI